MRVLTWNLFHGRSPEPRGRDLRDDFAAAIGSWDWDVALLQEVPPWWPALLGAACGATARSVRTSRTWIAPARWLARPLPDLIKSWGGGCDAILVRGAGVAEHRRVTLRLLPERRMAHGVRLEDGTWVVNLHAHVRPRLKARLDTARAGLFALDWAQGAPLLLGGDFNHPDPVVPGLRDLGGHGIDRVLGRGFERVAEERPDPLGLSDHLPVVLEVRPC